LIKISFKDLYKNLVFIEKVFKNIFREKYQTSLTRYMIFLRSLKNFSRRHCEFRTNCYKILDRNASAQPNCAV